MTQRGGTANQSRLQGDRQLPQKNDIAHWKAFIPLTLVR